MVFMLSTEGEWKEYTGKKLNEPKDAILFNLLEA